MRWRRSPVFILSRAIAALVRMMPDEEPTAITLKESNGFVFSLTYSLCGVTGQIAEPMPSLREDDEQR